MNRPNRFVATVDINGQKETVHIKTGELQYG
jgi:DNA-binding sugar fermentation-stimulating protein